MPLWLGSSIAPATFSFLHFLISQPCNGHRFSEPYLKDVEIFVKSAAAIKATLQGHLVSMFGAQAICCKSANNYRV